MNVIRRVYVTLLERLYLRVMQSSPPLPGTDPDDGGHMEMRWGWNDPTGNNRPLFVVIVKHTKTGNVTRMMMSPKQVDLAMTYTWDALIDQGKKFGYTSSTPPDYDTRWIRVPSE
jgi:hypothetical protein